MIFAMRDCVCGDRFDAFFLFIFVIWNINCTDKCQMITSEMSTRINNMGVYICGRINLSQRITQLFIFKFGKVKYDDYIKLKIGIFLN